MSSAIQKTAFMTILSSILRAILFRGKRSSIITRGYLTRCVPEIPVGHITPCLSMLIRYTAIMFRKLKTHKKLKARRKKRVIGQNVLVVSPNKQDNQPTYEAHSIQWHLPIVVWILPAYLLETFSCIYQRCSCL